MLVDHGITRARRLARAGRYGEAARCFAAHLETKPVSEALQEHIEFGFALLLAGDDAGARRAYERLRRVVASMQDLPNQVKRLWERFTNLVVGARRQVVLASVTAIVMTASGCGGGASSGGAAGSAPAADSSPQMVQPAETDHAGQQDEPADGVQELLHQELQRPDRDEGYSAHRYSGGVFLPTERRNPLTEE